MKSIYKILFLCLLAVQFLPAQTTFVGGRVGINLAHLDTEEGFGEGKQAGLDIAAVLRLAFNQNISIQPELHFIQKGYRFSEEDFASALILNYLEIPVLLRYDFLVSPSTHIYLQAGPSFGLGLSGKVTFDGERVDEEDIKVNFGSGPSETRPTDLGLAIGAGVGFTAGNGQLFLDLRYLHGFSNLSNREALPLANHRGINIAVGYLVPLN